MKRVFWKKWRHLGISITIPINILGIFGALVIFVCAKSSVVGGIPNEGLTLWERQVAIASTPLVCWLWLKILCSFALALTFVTTH